ncbi:MAG: hypothetical protein HOP25_05920 [Methylotenera sp.]|nr:hypothetical protein [Methylotenera sp.]
MKIPHAIDVENKIKVIGADRADSQAARGRYLCYGCNREVFLAKSKNRKVHFKHYPDEAAGCRYGKSQKLHTQAKERLAIVFENALKKRGPMPIMQFETPTGIQTVLPFIFGHVAKLEWSLKDIGRRPDVVILDASVNPVLAIEIKHTHGVNDQKSKDFANCWWVEVDARDVMKDDFVLKVRAHGNLPYQYELLGHQNMLFG